MHISLDSALGQQRRLNQVGGTISSIATPLAAYSLRSTTGGDPKAVRVRRDTSGAAGDDDEQDFTVSEINSGALLDFVGSGNDGFVSIWYDQVGVNHGLQSTQGSQPQIVEGGTLRDYLIFDGTNSHFVFTSALDFDDGSAFFVVKGTTPENQQTLLGGHSGNNYLPVLQRGSTAAPYTSSLTVGSDFVNGVAQSWTDRDDAYDAIVTNNYVLASFIDIDNSPSATLKDIGRGAGGTTWVWKGQMKEIVLYSTNQSTNRTALEANMNSYYSIF